jgi:hypothetical protein
MGIMRVKGEDALTFPDTDWMRTLSADTAAAGIRSPMYPISLAEIYDLAHFASPVVLSRHALKNELLRHGQPVFEGKFKVKCLDCGEIYKDYTPETCEVCASSNFREPDEVEKEKIESFLLNREIGVNKNKQTFLDILTEIEDDLNIADDYYLIIRKEYGISKQTGYIVTSKVKEIRRGDPKSMRIIGNLAGTMGGKYWVCPAHRKRPETRPGLCHECGSKLYDVKFVGIKMGGWTVGTNTPTANQYYIDGEVIHDSRYEPGLLYGFAPVLSLWLETKSVFAKTKYVFKYYENERPPKGMILVPTSNMLSLKRMWDYFLRMVKINPHYMPVLGYENINSKGQAKFINFMNTLAESDFLNIKQDFERIITAVYGVSGIFRGMGAAGAANQGLEITITNRAVESLQRTYNEKLFPKLLKEFGIREWDLKLLPPEEKDEKAEEELLLMKTQRAQAMMGLGFDIDWKENDFTFTKIKQPEPPIGMPGEGALPGIDEPGPAGYEASEHEQNFEGQPEIPWLKTLDYDTGIDDVDEDLLIKGKVEYKSPRYKISQKRSDGQIQHYWMSEKEVERRLAAGEDIQVISSNFPTVERKPFDNFNSMKNGFFNILNANVFKDPSDIKRNKVAKEDAKIAATLLFHASGGSRDKAQAVFNSFFRHNVFEASTDEVNGWFDMVRGGIKTTNKHLHRIAKNFVYPWDGEKKYKFDISYNAIKNIADDRYVAWYLKRPVTSDDLSKALIKRPDWYKEAGAPRFRTIEDYKAIQEKLGTIVQSPESAGKNKWTLYHKHADARGGECHEHEFKPGGRIQPYHSGSPDVKSQKQFGHSGTPCNPSESTGRRGSRTQVGRGEERDRDPSPEVMEFTSFILQKDDFLQRLHNNDRPFQRPDELPMHWGYLMSDFNELFKKAAGSTHSPKAETITAVDLEMFSHITNPDKHEAIKRMLTPILAKKENRINYEKLRAGNRKIWEEITRTLGSKPRKSHWGRKDVKSPFRQYLDKHPSARTTTDLVIELENGRGIGASLKQEKRSWAGNKSFKKYLSETNLSGVDTALEPRPEKTPGMIALEQNFEKTALKIKSELIYLAKADPEKFMKSFLEFRKHAKTKQEMSAVQVRKKAKFEKWLSEGAKPEDFNFVSNYQFFARDYPKEAKRMKYEMKKIFGEGIKRMKETDPKGFKTFVKGFTREATHYHAIEKGKGSYFTMFQYPGIVVGTKEMERIGLTENEVNRKIESGELTADVASNNEAVLIHKGVPIATATIRNTSSNMSEPKLSFIMREEIFKQMGK